jgi:hypothetical protein
LCSPARVMRRSSGQPFVWVHRTLLTRAPEFFDHLFSVIEKILAPQEIKGQFDLSKGELLKRREESTTLLEATTAVTSPLDRDKVPAVLSAFTGNAVCVTVVTILLLFEGGGLLVVKAAHPAPHVAGDPAGDTRLKSCPDRSFLRSSRTLPPCFRRGTDRGLECGPGRETRPDRQA